MNILHVVNIYFVIPYFLGDQLLYFKEKGYIEHVICSPSEEINGYSKLKGFKYKEIAINRSISLIRDVIAVLKIRTYIKKNQIEIVTGHTPKGALLGIIAAWIENVPKRIYFRHGLVFETSKGLKRKLLIIVDKLTALLATQIVNVSASVAEISLKEQLNSHEKQIILNKGTCNGISLQKFSKANLEKDSLANLKEELNINENSFVIGFTGRLVKDKGIVELVDAFKKLQGPFPNLKLLLVGMLEERDSLPIETVEFIKDNSNIIYTGYVSFEIIEYYYALMDVFILLSYREGFPTSVLEASAMNLPVITTRATGCIDSIIEGETGFFVGYSAQELANVILFFIKSKNKCTTLGNNGRKFVEDNFASEIIWQEIEKLYINNETNSHHRHKRFCWHKLHQQL